MFRLDEPVFLTSHASPHSAALTQPTSRDVPRLPCPPVLNSTSQCGKTVADSSQGANLLFFEDGNSMYLLLKVSDIGKGIYCRLRDVGPGKGPSDKNPYASVAHVLCANSSRGKICGKKVRSSMVGLLCPGHSSKEEVDLLTYWEHMIRTFARHTGHSIPSALSLTGKLPWLAWYPLELLDMLAR